MKNKNFDPYETHKRISNLWTELNQKTVLVNDISSNFLMHLSLNDLLKLFDFIDKNINDGTLKLESWEDVLKQRQLVEESRKKGEIKET